MSTYKVYQRGIDICSSRNGNTTTLSPGNVTTAFAWTLIYALIETIHWILVNEDMKDKIKQLRDHESFLYHLAKTCFPRKDLYDVECVIQNIYERMSIHLFIHGDDDAPNKDIIDLFNERCALLVALRTRRT